MELYKTISKEQLKNRLNVDVIDDSSIKLNETNDQLIIDTTSNYFSQIFKEIPVGYLIDKTLPGVGLTSFSKTNKQNLILIAPYLNYIDMFSENDYLVITSDMFSENEVNKNINKDKDKSIYNIESLLNNKLNEYIKFCTKLSKPLKIVIMIDSFHKLKYHKWLFDVIDVIIVDEIHSHLYSMNLRNANIRKSFSLIEELKEKTTFVSATLPKKTEFDFLNNIKTIKINFSKCIKYNLGLLNDSDKKTSSIEDTLKHILNKFIHLERFSFNDKEFSSVTIFINNLTLPRKLINELNIKEEFVSYICSKSNKGDIYNIRYDSTNKIKMNLFNFVTESGYNAIEWNDSSNLTIIYSDTNILYKTLDKNETLQALCRNRSFLETGEINAIILNKLNKDMKTDRFLNDFKFKLQLEKDICNTVNNSILEENESIKDRFEIAVEQLDIDYNKVAENKYEYIYFDEEENLAKINYQKYFNKISKLYDIEKMYNPLITKEEYFGYLGLNIHDVKFNFNSLTVNEKSKTLFNEYVKYAKQNVAILNSPWPYEFTNKNFIKLIVEHYKAFNKINTNYMSTKNNLLMKK